MLLLVCLFFLALLISPCYIFSISNNDIDTACMPTKCRIILNQIPCVLSFSHVMLFMLLCSSCACAFSIMYIIIHLKDFVCSKKKIEHNGLNYLLFHKFSANFFSVLGFNFYEEMNFERFT